MITIILGSALALALFVSLYKIIRLIFFRINIAKRLSISKKVMQGDKLREVKRMIKRNPSASNRSISKLEKMLLGASVEMEEGRFLKICIISCITISVLLFTLTNSIHLAIASLAFFPFIIYVFLENLKKRKIKAFSSQLPDIIDFFSSSLKSGYSLMQAINIIAQEGPNPAAQEFKHVSSDVNLGKTYEEAFDRMVAKNPIEDLEILIAGIIISKETGGNLAQILDTIAATIRERERIRGEIKSLTAQGRLSGVILILLPIGMFAFIWLMNPSYVMPLFTHPIGKILLFGGIANQVIGGLVIRKIINIDW